MRSKILSLYRAYIRATRGLGDLSVRRETRRDSFTLDSPATHPNPVFWWRTELRRRWTYYGRKTIDNWSSNYQRRLCWLVKRVTVSEAVLRLNREPGWKNIPTMCLGLGSADLLHQDQFIPKQVIRFRSPSSDIPKSKLNFVLKVKLQNKSTIWLPRCTFDWMIKTF